MHQTTTRKKPKPFDITLMTLLAIEATADARRLLREHGMEDAKDYRDLEEKLATLYFSSPDKIALEKELAAIHPHRKWLEKYIEPQTKEILVEVPAKAMDAPPPKLEVQSNAEGTQQQNSNSAAPIRAMDIVAFVSLSGLIGISIYIVATYRK